MRLITKELVRTITAADPGSNRLVRGLEIHLRFGGTIHVAAVTQVKGGLECMEVNQPGRIHLVDEENIAGVTVTLDESLASDAGVYKVAQLVTHAEKNGRKA